MEVYDELERALKEIERLQMAIKDTKENADAIIIEQQEEIERLNNIIKEAIEYIKTLDYENEETYDIGEFVRTELLEILQGSDK